MCSCGCSHGLTFLHVHALRVLKRSWVAVLAVFFIGSSSFKPNAGFSYVSKINGAILSKILDFQVLIVIFLLTGKIRSFWTTFVLSRLFISGRYFACFRQWRDNHNSDSHNYENKISGAVLNKILDFEGLCLLLLCLRIPRKIFKTRCIKLIQSSLKLERSKSARKHLIAL